MAIWIDSDLCNVCGNCITKCSYNAIILKNDILTITDRCTECGICIETCKSKAIFGNIYEEKIIPDFSKYSDVWVFIENTPKGIRRVSIEILGKAQRLANALGENVTALILGFNLSNSIKFLKEIGIKDVLVVDNEKLKNYDSKYYADIIKDIVKTRKPNIFLFGATYLGRDLAPRVAKLVSTGLTADCTSLEIDSEEKILIQTRPAFGGNVLATIVNRFSRPQMATIRTGVMAKYKCKKNETPNIQFLEQRMSNKISTKIIKSFEESNFYNELDKVKTIIGGGRGMKNASGFKILYRLASLLNGKVVGTRVAVENGWVSEENQVGQTGHSIMPNLYIACGISGAIQHRAGILNSKFIVAINKDPNATIFKIANWGIIGNVFDILPEFIKQLEIKCLQEKNFAS